MSLAESNSCSVVLFGLRLFFLREDAPDGHSVAVTAAKVEPGSGSQCFCLKCTYVKRGSFKKFKQMPFLRLLAKNPQLKSKSLGSLKTSEVLVGNHLSSAQLIIIIHGFVAQFSSW